MPDYIYYIDSNMTDGGYTSGRVQLHSAEILSEGGLGAVVTQNVTLPYRGVGAALQATTGGILAIPGYVPGSSATTGPVYYITPTGSSLRATQGAFSLPQPLGRASVCSYSGGRYAFVAGGEQDPDYSSKLYRITLTDSARPSAVSLIGELPVPPGGMSAPNLIFVHNSKLWVLLNTPNGADLFAHGLTATGTLNTFGWKQIGTIRGYYPFRKSDQGIGFSPDGTFIFIAAASAAGTNVILRGKLCGDTILEWWPIEPYGLSDATSIPFLTMQDNTMYCLAQKGGTWAWHNAWIPTTGPSTESPNLFSTGITFNYYMDSPGGAANRVTLGKTFPENYRAISTTELHPELSGNQMKPTFYLNPQPATLAREMGSVFGYVTDDSGAVTLYGSIDSGPYTTQGFDMPNDSDWEWVVPALSEGQHNIKIRAVDTAGNFSEQQYQVLLDQTPPDLSTTYNFHYIVGMVSDYTSGISSVIWGSSTAGYPTTFGTYYPSSLASIPCNELAIKLPTYYGSSKHYVSVIVEDSAGNTYQHNKARNESSNASEDPTAPPPPITTYQHLINQYKLHSYNYWNMEYYNYGVEDPGDWLWGGNLGWYFYDKEGGDLFVYGLDGSNCYDTKTWLIPEDINFGLYRYTWSYPEAFKLAHLWETEYSGDVDFIHCVQDYDYQYLGLPEGTKIYVDLNLLLTRFNDILGTHYATFDEGIFEFNQKLGLCFFISTGIGAGAFATNSDVSYYNEFGRQEVEYCYIRFSDFTSLSESGYVPITSDSVIFLKPLKLIDTWLMYINPSPIFTYYLDIILVKLDDPVYVSVRQSMNHHYPDTPWDEVRFPYPERIYTKTTSSSSASFISSSHHDYPNAGYTWLYNLYYTYIDDTNNMRYAIDYPRLQGGLGAYNAPMIFGLTTTQYPDNTSITIYDRDENDPLIYYGLAGGSVNYIPQEYQDSTYYIGVNPNFMRSPAPTPTPPPSSLVWVTADGVRLGDEGITIVYNMPWDWYYYPELYNSHDETSSFDAFLGVTISANSYYNLPAHIIEYEGNYKLATNFSLKVFNLRNQIDYLAYYDYPPDNYCRFISDPPPPIWHFDWSVVWVDSDPYPWTGGPWTGSTGDTYQTGPYPWTGGPWTGGPWTGGPWTGSTGDTYQTGPLSYSDGILKDLELYSTYEIS